MNKERTHINPSTNTFVYRKCLIYRALRPWLQNLYRCILHSRAQLLHILHIKNVICLCQSILHPDIEMEIRYCMPVGICYILLLFFNRHRFFRIYFEWIFYRTLAEKLAARTKFEVKRHFTIRAHRRYTANEIRIFPVSIFAKLLCIRSKSQRRRLSAIKHVRGAIGKKYFIVVPAWWTIIKSIARSNKVAIQT